MSVVTTSDRQMDLARYEVERAIAHAERAVVALDAALKPDTWGADEWSAEFQAEVARVRKRLVKLRKRVGLGERRLIGTPDDFVPMERCRPSGGEP